MQGGVRHVIIFRGGAPSHVESRATILCPHVAVARRRRRRFGGPARSHEPKGPQAGPPSTATKADDANQAPASGRMFVVGRVLGPGGKPVTGAAVMVHARNLTPGLAPFATRFKLIPLADARAAVTDLLSGFDPLVSVDHHSRSPNSRKYFHNDVWEPLQGCVVGEKSRAAMLDRGRQVQGVESRELIIRPDPRGSFPNRDSDRQHSRAWAGKECRI